MKNEVTELPTKPLTQEEENHLAAHRQREDNRNRLVLHAMREAMAYAHRCCRGALEQSDLFSLCYDALHRAAKRFSPNRIRFFAYAKADVRRGITMAWKDKDVVKNASMHEDESVEPERFSNDILENPLNDSISNGDGDRSWEDHIIDREQSVDPEFEKIHIAERWAMIKPIIDAKLTDTEKMVIDLYYNGDLTFQQIGDMLDVCRARTQMIHFQALKKVRCELMRRKALFTE